MNKNLDELFIVSGNPLDEDAKSVVGLVRQWADREILSKRMEYREGYSKLFAEQRRRLNLDIGIQWLTLPEENGGFGWNDLSKAVDIAHVLCEIGRADASIGSLLAVQYAILATCTMKHNLNRKLCDMFSSLYISDTVRTPALILPGPGMAGKTSALFLGRSILTQVKAKKGGYTITGRNLRPLLAGAAADLFCVVCAGEKDDRACLALVPGDAHGISTGSPLRTTGLNACGNADITIDMVSISKENLIDHDGAAEELHTWLNLLLGAVSVGAGMNFFEILSDWSETRVIKGGFTLKENPLCASVLADVAEETALAKMLLFDLAQVISASAHEGLHTTRAFTYSEIIGNRIQSSIIKAINRGMELMGSAGYAKEWHVEKHWRDVKTIQSLLCGVGAEAPVKMDTARFFYNCAEL
ncbi:MAG TPA: acyl-CoA dehydrogenase family protein [Deltaproteobacteria bacterium]|nr:acyl-CoA dehydrogenase family protein [Deltaproteobacteria bacterium]